MANTTYVDFDGVYETLPDMSQPYVIINGTLVEFDIFQVRKVHMGLGAGGVLSSANDMAKYMDFLISHGRIGDRQIVPEVNLFHVYGGENDNKIFDLLDCDEVAVPHFEWVQFSRKQNGGSKLNCLW